MRHLNKQERAQWAEKIVQASEGNPPDEMPTESALACMEQLHQKSVLLKELKKVKLKASNGTPGALPTAHPNKAALSVGASHSSGASSLSTASAHQSVHIELDGTIERALALKNAGHQKVGALVFCSAKRPGGGWLSGASAQEESISLCSTWALGCEHDGFHKAVSDYDYTDEVLSLEGHIIAKRPGEWLDLPEAVHFVGFAAPNLKAWRESGVSITSSVRSALTLSKLTHRCELALEAFEKAGCDAVVLGAIGCGVFEMDPVLAAKAWQVALSNREPLPFRVEFALTENPSPAIAEAFKSLDSKSTTALVKKKKTM